MLTIESGVVHKVIRCYPISFKHMSFSCLFLDPHQTSNHSKIGVDYENESNKDGVQQLLGDSYRLEGFSFLYIGKYHFQVVNYFGF